MIIDSDEGKIRLSCRLLIHCEILKDCRPLTSNLIKVAAVHLNDSELNTHVCDLNAVFIDLANGSVDFCV